MNFWANVLKFLDLRMETPPLYGAIHIIWILLTIATTILLCRYYKNADDKKIRNIIAITAIVVFVLEIYKQINYSFSYENGIKFSYQWYAFPFQFCSTPMYIGLLTLFFKKGKVHEYLCGYLATFACFAGLCVLIYPGDVYSPIIGINIQTMVCHGSMIILAVFLLYSGYVKLELKTVLKGAVVFTCCIAVAIIMNEIAFISGLLEEHTFNMFLISPHCEPSLPVYSIIQNNVAYPWCLIFYVGAFTAASFVIIGIGMLIKRISAGKPKIENK